MDKLNYLAIAALCSIGLASCSSDYDDEDGTSYYDGYVSNERASVMDAENMPFNESGDRFSEIIDNPFIDCSKENTSTFSVDADGASYAIMRKYVTSGYAINPSSVRIEEFLNYFTYDYPAPQDDNTVAISTEIADCPWNSNHKLLRLGIRGKEISKDEMPKSNYVFLIDVSGSMYPDDKLPLLKQGLTTLATGLDPEDRISIITYSGKVAKLLESTPVKQIDKINSAIQKLSAEGSTNGGQALIDAYNEALANYIQGGNNRVILGTDGDFNVGVTSTDDLLKIVSENADKGIFTTVCGFGSGNLNDGMMEKISNRGNGTYEYIDSEDQMMKVFAHEKSKLISVACDSKCQVTFNPDIVKSFRLIGYENRVMNKEDFADDTKDAGEIGAGQTITALYEIELLPTDAATEPDTEAATAASKIATFDFRYKKSLGTESIPLSIDINTTDIQAEPSGEFNFAAGVAAYGMVLRDSEYKGDATLQLAKSLAQKGLSYDPHGYRAGFVRLIELNKN